MSEDKNCLFSFYSRCRAVRMIYKTRDRYQCLKIRISVQDVKNPEIKFDFLIKILKKMCLKA